MFWIHGGAFFVGQGDDYDPTNLVAQGMVVVTNQLSAGASASWRTRRSPRKGMAHRALWSHDRAGAALGAEQHRRLGGDDNNVTIFGDRPAGFSVESQLVISGGAGLFHKAIRRSGAYANSPLLQPTLAVSRRSAGRSRHGRLRRSMFARCNARVSADAIVSAEDGLRRWRPVGPSIDNKLWTTPVSTAFASAPTRGCPSWRARTMMISIVRRVYEATMCPPGRSPRFIFAQHEKVFGDLIGHRAGDAYPVSDYEATRGWPRRWRGPTSSLHADARCIGRTLRARDRLRLRVDDPKAPMLFLPPVPDIRIRRRARSEIQYIFTLAHSTLATDKQALSATMVQYWSNFAKTGDPNGPGLNTLAQVHPPPQTASSRCPGANGVAVTPASRPITMS